MKGHNSNMLEEHARKMRFPMIAEKPIPLKEKAVGQSKGVSAAIAEKAKWITQQVADSTITEYITRLVDFRTRHSCTDSAAAAAQWIYDKFMEFGYTDVYFDSFPQPFCPDSVDRNVVAVKPGTWNADKVVIIGGHYDSIAADCDPDTLAPGADDNGSGTVATLETARVLSGFDPDVTLMFIAFAAEEVGSYGSSHFAEEAFNNGMDIDVLFNMDMVAYTTGDTWEVSISIDSSSVHYGDIVALVAQDYTELIPLVSIGFDLGDVVPFYELGYGYVYAHDEHRFYDPYPHYHKSTDIVENISIPYLTNVTEMITTSIIFIAYAPQPPTGFRALNAGDGSSVYLNWDANSELDISGYNIYYGVTPGVYDSMKIVSATSDTLRNLIDGANYYLELTAVDDDGFESYPTTELEIEVSSRPLTPAAITSISFNDSIVIEWERNAEELDLAGYNVYRRLMDDPHEPDLLGFVPDPTTDYIDRVAEPYLLYAYQVTAVDTQVPANESEPTEEVGGRLATHDMGILVVDHTKDGSGGPFSPTDEAVDSYYSDLFDSYEIGAVWDTKDSLALDRPVMDYDLGLYSSVFWHSDVRGGTLMAPDTVAMRKYLNGGGNLWLSGWKLMASLTGESRPYYVFDDSTFVSAYIGVDSAKTTPNGVRDFIGVKGLLEEFPDLSVDSSNVSPLGVLYDMEILLPPFHGVEPIYAYAAEDSIESEFHGLPVAVMSNSVEYGLVVTDFPLYFIEGEDVQELVDAAMERFGEPVSVEGEKGQRLPLVFSLSQNYPNPFNPATTILFDIPGEASETQHTNLSIYDLRGRLVKVLIDEILKSGNHKVVWDGRDDRGEEIPSGVYFYKMKSGDWAFTRKMIVVR